MGFLEGRRRSAAEVITTEIKSNAANTIETELLQLHLEPFGYNEIEKVFTLKFTKENFKLFTVKREK